MARSPTSGIVAAQTATVNQPGKLVELTVLGTVYHFTTLDVTINFGGFSWTPADVEIRDLRWDSGGVSAGKMTLGDADLVWWTFALGLSLQDAPVRVWEVYASATTEAEPLWKGRIGGIRRIDPVVECDLLTDIEQVKAPRRRIQNVVPAKYLVPAGKVIMLGAVKWTPERKKNG